jgi:hypothetical protein
MLRRAVFVVRAKVDGATGPIELTFDNGDTFCFDFAAGRADVLITPGAWAEQFPEPVSEVNQDFLWSSGKWEIVDFGSALWSYRQIIGRPLTGVQALGSGGIRLDFDGIVIIIEAVADELCVDFERRVN